MTIGERIKHRRKTLGLSAEEVAEKMGVSAATVYRYESSDILNMGIDKLELIAKALKTTPAALMGWEEKTSNIPQFDNMLAFAEVFLNKDILALIKSNK